MKKIYIIIIVLIIVVGTLFFFGMGKKVEAPTPETSTIMDNKEVDVINTDNGEILTSVVKEFTVSGKNFFFTPSLITVKKGDRVKIIFENSAGFHDFKIDEYGIATKQTQSPTTEVLEFTADKAGSFEYYCSVSTHRAKGMKGTLVVE